MPYEYREHPTFSWSYSRHRMFRECPRKYYYHYYASHNGWDIAAPESARQAYRLKNLISLPMEVGAVVHQAASAAILRARSGGEVPTAEDLYGIVRRRLRRVWERSQDIDRSEWERSPKRWQIFREFYYGNGIGKDEAAEAADQIKTCLGNLLSSESFREAVTARETEVGDIEYSTPFSIDGTKTYAVPDLIYRKADETWMVVDWKTGKKHDDDVDQARVYALYMREVYGVSESDITVRIEYLDSGEMQEISFTQEDFENNITAIRDSISSMRDYLSDVAANAPLEKADFPLQVSYLCRFCEFYELDRDEIENKPAAVSESRIEGPEQAVAAAKDEAAATEELTAHDSCIEELNQKLGAAQEQHEQALAAAKKNHDMELEAEKREVKRQRKRANTANEKQRATVEKHKKAEDELKGANETIKQLRSQIGENKKQHRYEVQEARRVAHEEAKEDSEKTIDRLHREVAKLGLYLEDEQDGRKSDNDRLAKQLGDVVPEVMGDAWRNIHKGEPLSAYREAVTALETALRRILGNPLKPNNYQKLDLYPLMEMAAGKDYISRKQFDHLDRMRERRRNIFMHESEEEVRNSDNPLTESEARAAVAYLGQVIALLGA